MSSSAAPAISTTCPGKAKVASARVCWAGSGGGCTTCWRSVLCLGLARFDRGVHRDAAARVVAGESATAVARDVGCRRGTVSQWCRDAGWSWSGGVRAGLLSLTRPDAPESSRPSWVGRACPRPQPPLGCVGSRRAGTGTIRPWRQHQQHQHGSRGGAPTACRAAPARDGSGAASVSVTLSGF